MPASKRRHADHMRLAGFRLRRNLGRGRKKRPNFDIKTKFGEGGGDNLLTAVMAVLT